MKVWAYVAIVVVIGGIIAGFSHVMTENAHLTGENERLAGNLKVSQDNYATLSGELKQARLSIENLNTTYQESNALSVEKIEALREQLTAQQTDLRQLKELAENDEATREFLRDAFPRAIYCFMFPRHCETGGSGDEEGTGDGAVPAVDGDASRSSKARPRGSAYWRGRGDWRALDERRTLRMQYG